MRTVITGGLEMSSAHGKCANLSEACLVRRAKGHLQWYESWSKAAWHLLCGGHAHNCKRFNQGLSKWVSCCRFAAEAQIDGTYMFCKQESVIQAAKFLSSVSELSLQVGQLFLAATHMRNTAHL